MKLDRSVIGMAITILSAVAAYNLACSFWFSVRPTNRSLVFASGDYYIDGRCVRPKIASSVPAFSVGLIVRCLNKFQIWEHVRCAGSTLDRKSGVSHQMAVCSADKWLRHETGSPGMVQCEWIFIK
jgi:hypothetical protein